MHMCVFSYLIIFLSLGAVWLHGSLHVCVLDWPFLCPQVFVSIHVICAYCVSLDTGCVRRVSMRQKIFNPPTQFSKLGIRCPALFVLCVCVCVCVACVKKGGLLFVLLFLFFHG